MMQTASTQSLLHSDSAGSTGANPPSPLSSEGSDNALHGSETGVMERHREELAARGLLTPTLPHRAHLRPVDMFEIEEPTTVGRRLSQNLGTTMATAFGLMRDRTRLPDEEDVGSAPQGHPLPSVVHSPPPVPRLLQTERARIDNLAEDLAEISKNIFMICGVFPPLWLIYGWGGFDFIMRRWTQGELQGMDIFWKMRARVLGVIYGGITVAVWTLVAIYLL